MLVQASIMVNAFGIYRITLASLDAHRPFDLNKGFAVKQLTADGKA